MIASESIPTFFEDPQLSPIVPDALPSEEPQVKLSSATSVNTLTTEVAMNALTHFKGFLGVVALHCSIVGRKVKQLNTASGFLKAVANPLNLPFIFFTFVDMYDSVVHFKGWSHLAVKLCSFSSDLSALIVLVNKVWKSVDHILFVTEYLEMLATVLLSVVLAKKIEKIWKLYQLKNTLNDLSRLQPDDLQILDLNEQNANRLYDKMIEGNGTEALDLAKDRLKYLRHSSITGVVILAAKIATIVVITFATAGLGIAIVCTVSATVSFTFATVDRYKAREFGKKLSLYFNGNIDPKFERLENKLLLREVSSLTQLAFEGES
ncbi:MAG: hypothetical protein WD595_02780 [Waddliaceae bacterium]